MLIFEQMQTHVLYQNQLQKSFFCQVHPDLQKCKVNFLKKNKLRNSDLALKQMENRVRNRIKVILKEQEASEYRIKGTIVGCLTNWALFGIHEAALTSKMPTISK